MLLNYKSLERRIGLIEVILQVAFSQLPCDRYGGVQYCLPVRMSTVLYMFWTNSAYNICTMYSTTPALLVACLLYCTCYGETLTFNIQCTQPTSYKTTQNWRARNLYLSYCLLHPKVCIYRRLVSRFKKVKRCPFSELRCQDNRSRKLLGRGKMLQPVELFKTAPLCNLRAYWYAGSCRP